jgi:hypothetical protein
MANQVLIDHGMGRTMDEAQERLIENYERIAKPWRNG